MKKGIKRWIYLVAVLTICLGAAVFPVMYEGYQMYHHAVSEKSIEEAVAELRADEDYVTIDEISPSYLEGVVDSEDKRFYMHCGIDPISIGRAALIDLKERRFAEGGSTITQQLAKNLYFSFDKKLERKAAEVFMAFALEKRYSKDEILEMYCNIAYFGEGCYGLGEAAAYYYGVAPLQLTESQAEALIWTIKSPNHYHPEAYEKATA